MENLKHNLDLKKCFWVSCALTEVQAGLAGLGQVTMAIRPRADLLLKRSKLLWVPWHIGKKSVRFAVISLY